MGCSSGGCKLIITGSYIHYILLLFLTVMVRTITNKVFLFKTEFFEINGFEQFTINYCSEILQQYFLEQVLKNEQELYASEGIIFERIDFKDNLDVLGKYIIHVFIINLCYIVLYYQK